MKSTKEKTIWPQKIQIGVLKAIEYNIAEPQGVKKYFSNVKIAITNNKAPKRVIQYV